MCYRCIVLSFVSRKIQESASELHHNKPVLTRRAYPILLSAIKAQDRIYSM